MSKELCNHSAWNGLRVRDTHLFGEIKFSQDHIHFKVEIDMSQPWNSDADVPRHMWLEHFQTQEDKKRLECMGNIVVPLQGRKALSFLAEVMATSKP